MKTLICNLFVLALVLSNPVVAATKSLSSTIAGTSIATEDADFNGDLQSSGVGSYTGKGKLGDFVVRTQGDREPWDGSTFCDFDESGAPIAIEEVYLGFVSAVSYSDGEDQWFDTLDTLQPSTLCFNFVDNTFTYEVHTVITGGAGKFEGATGYATTTGSGRLLKDGFSASVGTISGEIAFKR